MSGSKMVYSFPNGFQKEADRMFGWLRYYNLSPEFRWAKKGGEARLEIRLPRNQVAALRMMQKHDPARFGSAKKVSEFQSAHNPRRRMARRYSGRNPSLFTRMNTAARKRLKRRYGAKRFKSIMSRTRGGSMRPLSNPYWPDMSAEDKASNRNLLAAIRPGDQVTIMVPAGRGMRGQEWKKATGRAVMRGPYGWVLNMGGAYGTPGIAGVDNVVRVRRTGKNPRKGGRVGHDFTVVNYGSMVGFEAESAAANRWFKKHVASEPWQKKWKNEVVVDRRYAQVIVAAIKDAGMSVRQVTINPRKSRRYKRNPRRRRGR